MQFSKSPQGRKSAITVHHVLIEWTLMLFVLIQNFIAVTHGLLQIPEKPLF